MTRQTGALQDAASWQTRHREQPDEKRTRRVGRRTAAEPLVSFGSDGNSTSLLGSSLTVTGLMHSCEGPRKSLSWMCKSGLAGQQLQPVGSTSPARLLTSVRASAAEKAMAKVRRSSQW